jgi:SAM-dependent methyltransferase
MSTQKTKDWWKAFYEDSPFELYLQRKDEKEVERTLDFLEEQLNLGAGNVVFDQCCGMGSLALPLSERGYRLIGVDLCSKYVQSATMQASARKLQAEFACDDAFVYRTKSGCDAAFNWWTSFGYADDDDRNLEMLRRAADSLKPGARFALDYPNIPFVLRNFLEQEVKEFPHDGGVVRFVRDTVIDLRRGTRSQTWTFILPDEKQSVHETSLRMYLPHSIKDMLKQVGFVDIAFYGDVDGSPLTVDSPRCIAVSSKS